jgi:PadR family transcriptional regulator PadR
MGAGNDISNFDNEMPKPRKTDKQERRDQDLYGGLIRLHILHHASKEPVFGLWIIEELGHHGYKLSPGTLYPLLHALERKGYLRSTTERSGKSSRRMYQATPLGRKALAAARQKVSELFGELLEEE